MSVNFKNNVRGEECMANSMGNILLIGNSGAGKSTLINTVFSCEVAETAKFGKRRTQKLKTYISESLNYRVIDTKGLELGFWNQKDALKQVDDYIKKVIKDGDEEAVIDVIWYCVPATEKRFFKENVNQILRIYKKFPDVPIIIVLTKSFCALDERIENETLVRGTLEKYDTKNRIKLADIISINSAPFRSANNDIIDIYGIEQLVERTNEIMPEAKRIREVNMLLAKRKLKKKQANITVATCTIGAVVIGAVPVKIPDAAILVPIQTAMVRSVTKRYGVEEDLLVAVIMENVAVSGIAKSVLELLKKIPGLNIGIAVLNASVAGVFTAAIGEGTIYICEKIVDGEIKVEDREKIAAVIKEKMPKLVEAIVPEIEKLLNKEEDKKLDVIKIKEIFTNFFIKKDAK